MAEKRTLAAVSSALLMVDFQARLMPAIAGGEGVVAQARRLKAAAALLDVPVLLTEQNPAKLGSTLPELAGGAAVLAKMTFDAGADPGFAAALPPRDTVVVCGCEAHVCVLQTALSLLGPGRHVVVVEDAIGSRAPASKAAALRRMERHGVEVVTTEMVVFEWLGSADHPRFREAVALVK